MGRGWHRLRAGRTVVGWAAGCRGVVGGHVAPLRKALWALGEADFIAECSPGELVALMLAQLGATVLDKLGRFRDRHPYHFRQKYFEETALATGRFLERDPIWTDNIADGSESFVTNVAERTRNRTDLDIHPSSDRTSTVRDREGAYN